MRGAGRALVVATLLALMLAAAPARADDDPLYREWGFRVSGGYSPSNHVQYYALQPYVGFRLWHAADDWFEAHDIAARWIVEPWVALVHDDKGPFKTTSFEIGVSPLFARLTFFKDALFRPYVEAGLGILYTDLRGQDLGTRVQFSSQGGAGLEYMLRPDLSLTLSGRFRHISNAGMGSSNPGFNTLYGMLGVTFR
jgi:opacity protein-like surface antigen